jgi:hypothetical protein
MRTCAAIIPCGGISLLLTHILFLPEQEMITSGVIWKLIPVSFLTFKKIATLLILWKQMAKTLH